ncbi:SRPBCC family protein [Aeromicrobium sp.]|uniref:SRPBCC family protein n=1 Tax=Aeromicrobium sp. TaxID=1871063 RepID=UPI003C6A0584
MPHIVEAGVDIARTPQDVFDVVADPARLPEWQPSFAPADAGKDVPASLRLLQRLEASGQGPRP